MIPVSSDHEPSLKIISEAPQAELAEFLDVHGGVDSFFRRLKPQCSGDLVQEEFVEGLQKLGYVGDASQEFFSIDTDHNGKISQDDLKHYLDFQSKWPEDRAWAQSSQCSSTVSSTADAFCAQTIKTQLNALKMELRRMQLERQTQHTRILELLKNQVDRKDIVAIVKNEVASQVSVAVREALSSSVAPPGAGQNATAPPSVIDIDAGTAPSELESRIFTVEALCMSINDEVKRLNANTLSAASASSAPPRASSPGNNIIRRSSPQPVVRQQSSRFSHGVASEGVRLTASTIGMGPDSSSMQVPMLGAQDPQRVERVGGSDSVTVPPPSSHIVLQSSMDGTRRRFVSPTRETSSNTALTPRYTPGRSANAPVAVQPPQAQVRTFPCQAGNLQAGNSTPRVPPSMTRR